MGALVVALVGFDVGGEVSTTGSSWLSTLDRSSLLLLPLLELFLDSFLLVLIFCLLYNETKECLVIVVSFWLISKTQKKQKREREREYSQRPMLVDFLRSKPNGLRIRRRSLSAVWAPSSSTRFFAKRFMISIM